MKAKTNITKLLAVGFLTTIGFTAFSENRLADDKNRDHKNFVHPENKCLVILEGQYKRGCITEEEYKFGISESPQRIPICIEQDDNIWEFHRWCYCDSESESLK